jgi:hypothetical protein
VHGRIAGIDNIHSAAIEKVFQHQQSNIFVLFTWKLERSTDCLILKPHQPSKANIFTKVVVVDWKPGTRVSTSFKNNVRVTNSLRGQKFMMEIFLSCV